MNEYNCNNLYQHYTGGYIDVLNYAKFRIRAWGSYNFHSELYEFVIDKINTGNERRVYIPLKAIEIKLNIEMYSELCGWVKIFNSKYENSHKKCFICYGVFEQPFCKEISHYYLNILQKNLPVGIFIPVYGYGKCIKHNNGINIKV